MLPAVNFILWQPFIGNIWMNSQWMQASNDLIKNWYRIHIKVPWYDISRYSENSSHTHQYTYPQTSVHFCAYRTYSGSPTRIYAHLCTPVHTRAHPCITVHTRAHPCIPMHTCAHPFTPVHTRAHLRTSHTPVHIRTHPWTHGHICTHEVRRLWELAITEHFQNSFLM